MKQQIMYRNNNTLHKDPKVTITTKIIIVLWFINIVGLEHEGLSLLGFNDISNTIRFYKRPCQRYV